MNNLIFNFQPTLENDFIKIQPLKTSDFESLYKIASDPLLWAQHPNKDRYKKEVFEQFFIEGIESKGAFLVFDNKTNQVIGSSRFYELDKNQKSIVIGFTFIARSHWGTNHNKDLKTLMLDYAFQFVDKVIFHIGINNIRSQKATEKLGAIKIGQMDKGYVGEEKKINFIYELNKATWLENK